jgi:hypothetical protein
VSGGFGSTVCVAGFVTLTSEVIVVMSGEVWNTAACKPSQPTDGDDRADMEDLIEWLGHIGASGIDSARGLPACEVAVRLFMLRRLWGAENPRELETGTDLVRAVVRWSGLATSHKTIHDRDEWLSMMASVMSGELERRLGDDIEAIRNDAAGTWQVISEESRNPGHFVICNTATGERRLGLTPDMLLATYGIDAAVMAEDLAASKLSEQMPYRSIVKAHPQGIERVSRGNYYIKHLDGTVVESDVVPTELLKAPMGL